MNGNNLKRVGTAIVMALIGAVLIGVLIGPLMKLLTFLAVVTVLGGVAYVFLRPEAPPERLHESDWADWQDVQDMSADPKKPDAGRGVLLGAFYEKDRPHVLALKPGGLGRKEMGHVLVTGVSRSGKGLMLTSNLLNWEGSAVVIDLKGEFYKKTAGYRAQQGGTVILLDPTADGQGQHQGAQFDPVRPWGNEEEELAAIANVILEADKDGSNAIFGQAAVHTLVAMFRASYVLGVPTFKYVDLLLKSGREAAFKELWGIRDRDPLGVIEKRVMLTLNARPDDVDWQDTRGLGPASWSNLTTRLANLIGPGVLAMTGGADLAPEMLWTRPTTVYLVCPESRLNDLKPVLRIMLHTLVQKYMSNADKHPDAARPALLLGFDEAGVIPPPNLSATLSTAAGRGVVACVLVQDLAQLEATYGKGEANAILSNCHTKIFHPTGSPETAKFIEQASGKTSVLVDSYSVQHATGLENNERHSVSSSFKERALITAEEVRGLPLTTVLMFSDNRPPVRARRLEWFSLPELKRRAEIAAPAVPTRSAWTTLKKQEPVKPISTSSAPDFIPVEVN